MMVFTADMKPMALLMNAGDPFQFTCDLCGTNADGLKVQPEGDNRESWAVLPEEWAEIEDRTDYAKKQFLICCESGDCQHEAKSRS